MADATFLLIINIAIGLTFAVAFAAAALHGPGTAGFWFAAGFVCAAGSVFAETLSRAVWSVRLVSTLSYGLLMAATTLIALGLVRHYLPGARLWPIWMPALAATAFNAVIGVDLTRGTWLAALTYQWPFAAMLSVAAFVVLRHGARRPVDRALAAILALSALQFAAKGVAIGMYGADVGVRAYLTSDYARYSQSFGSILSVMLGVALLAFLVAEAMRHLAHDGLTGALVRTAFVSRADGILRARSTHPVGLILCDIDHFKTINDGHGHAAGDDALREVGRLLRDAGGTSGLCGRIGGDEFCLIVPRTDPAHLQRLAGQLARTAGDLRFGWLPANRRLSLSLGIALAVPGDDLAATMARADQALYAAKSEGRGRHVMAQSAPGPGAPA